MSDNPAEMPPYFGAPGFSDSYWIELLYNRPPQPDIDALVQKVSAEMPIETAVKVIGDGSGSVSLAYPDRLISFGDARMPVITNVFWGSERINIADYKAALEQTWNWDGARKALGRCWYRVIVGDITGSRLPYQERFRRLTTLAAACVELTRPEVCFWKEAGCLVEPARFAEVMGRFCNVREFNIGITGDKIMDTLGLAAIGLPDVEMTFSRLGSDQVAAFLYRTAGYLFEGGDIINDGDTVPGPGGERWKTLHDVATLEPARTVVRVMVTGNYAPSKVRR